ncbi:MAG TPA: zinc ribbon domain-containing protein [Myxococcota bacterium]|nr:zinc ribbon domain-containing protein [Myxococcota bacterium]
MPTYEYLCKACDHEFEREQRISEPPVKTCPKCKAKQVKRLLSAPRFHLKGGGWYSDLYSKPAGKKGADKKEGASETTASESGASKSGSEAPAKGGSDTSKGGSGSTPKAAA